MSNEVPRSVCCLIISSRCLFFALMAFLPPVFRSFQEKRAAIGRLDKVLRDFQGSVDLASAVYYSLR